MGEDTFKNKKVARHTSISLCTATNTMQTTQTSAISITSTFSHVPKDNFDNNYFAMHNVGIIQYIPRCLGNIETRKDAK